MLGKSLSKDSSNNNGSVNLIGAGTQITGDINCAGDVRIDGTLTGNIITSGKFVLGPQGLVEGNVTCSNADISGEIKGVLKINELLQLKASAKIKGDIITAKLSIESGAVFNGTCNMGAVVKNIAGNNNTVVNGAKTA
ncbi:MAG: polymer-forming cytoskeletal protein [Bacteroidetes bacterium]|nr:polymer-forming cytoskeletal protein [Bacteroidota bacterium]